MAGFRSLSTFSACMCHFSSSFCSEDFLKECERLDKCPNMKTKRAKTPKILPNCNGNSEKLPIFLFLCFQWLTVHEKNTWDLDENPLQLCHSNRIFHTNRKRLSLATEYCTSLYNFLLLSRDLYLDSPNCLGIVLAYRFVIPWTIARLRKHQRHRTPWFLPCL